MAEYKYRALGWKDDDIASLNVVDGTAEDNQVELQITKQGAGGTIDGPAIIGKDGITIDKAADSEKIEISGSGCVQADLGTIDGQQVYMRNAYSQRNSYYNVVISDDWLRANRLPLYFNTDDTKNGQINSNATLLVGTPKQPYNATNKKYVDDNFVKIPSPAPTNWSVLVYTPIDKKYTVYPLTRDATYSSIPYRDYEKGNFKVGDLTASDDGQYCANKKYVDDAVAGSSAALETELNKKQATLVSGTNIKTINGNSLLGSGDLVIESGGTEVTPNPTLSGSEAALSALQIGDTKYRIEGTLTTLMVGIDSSLLGG